MNATLETDRLLLRPFRASDFDRYAEMFADPETMQFLGDGRPQDRATAWRSLALVIGHWSLRGYGLWAVEERSSGLLVGRVGCWNPEGWPDFELAWMLHRPVWGRGYATEAARAALEYAFTELGRTHVVSLIAPDHLRSIRVAERLGERPVGSTELLGKPVLIYRLDRSEWEGDFG